MSKKYKISTVFAAVDKMSKPIGKMQKSMQKMTKTGLAGVKRLNRGMSKFGSGIARGAGVAGAAIGGLLLGINKISDSMDKLSKTARRLQIPIQELQKMRFIGEQSGLDTKEIDKGLGTFAKRLGELQAGSTGALISRLKKAHPELLKQLKNTKSITKAFELMTIAIRKQKNPMLQAALASAAYSKKGMNFIQISHNSASELKILNKQAIENGIVTQKQANAAETYNDMRNRLSKTIRNFMVNVAAPLIPILTKIADAIRQWAIKNRELIGENITKYAKSFIDTLQKYAPYIPIILKLTAVFIGLMLALKTMIIVMTALNLVMSLNPITLLVLAIVAAAALLGGLVYFIYKEWDGVVAYYKNLFHKAGMIFDSFVEIVKMLFLKFNPIGLIYDNWDGITAYFKNLFAGIVSIYDRTIGKISSGIDAVKSTFSWGNDDAEVNANINNTAAAMVTPQERISRSFTEKKETFDINVHGSRNAQVSATQDYGQRLKLFNSGY